MPKQEQSIPTIWGDIFFEEFYTRTRKLIAQKLRQHGILDSHDIDDCMQSAYFKIWQQMETQREIFADKPLSYIIQSLFFASKVQRFSHKRHFNKVSFTDIDRIEAQYAPINQLETWIDIQSALAIVTQEIWEDDIALLALYSLITQVKVRDVQQLAGCSSRTMSKRRNQIRERFIDTLLNDNQIQSEISESVQVIMPPIAVALLEII
ncbi:MAG: hypothetical protein Phog2KO_47420 [Phototrophicaceae bacterium]